MEWISLRFPLARFEGFGQDTATLRSVSHCQSLNSSRNLLFSSFPVEVCGSSATTTNASGTCHGAKVCCRKERNSQGSTVRFSFRTTRARGRSCHFGCGTAMTAASRIAACPTNAFSTSTELIHSPPDLIRSFRRSVILTYPSESIVTTSPVRNHPSYVHLSF